MVEIPKFDFYVILNSKKTILYDYTVRVKIY